MSGAEAALAASLHHVALGARDVRRVSEFYRDAFGLRVVAEHRYDSGELRSIWLELGEGVLMVEHWFQGHIDEEHSKQEHSDQEPRMVEGIGKGPFLLAFSVLASERSRREEHLVSLGASIEARSEFSSYARDPEGNRVALSCYPLEGRSRSI